MIITLKSIISCDVLGLEESFQGIFFGHAFLKTCRYATTNEILCKDLRYVSIKTAQRDLQNCITWPKRFEKGKQKQDKACVNSSLPPRKLNI
jgi:hypothetical protein